jgi:hypothetical protein
MESLSKLNNELSKRVNRNEGLKAGAIICGIIAVGSTIGVLVPEITVSPALAEIQQWLKGAASTALAAEAPILTIMGINGKNIKLLRKIGGIDEEGKAIDGLKTSNADCAILEINKRKEQKKGIYQAMFLTAFVAGVAGLGIALADKDMPKILEFITKLKEEFIAGIVMASATIAFELARILGINSENKLIRDTFNVSNKDVKNANLKNGERRPKVKTLGQKIKSGMSKIAKKFKS